MEYLVAFIVYTASAILSLLMFCMLLRVLLSFFAPESESAFVMLIYTITEIVVYPVRMLFQKLGWFQNVPIDMAFLCASLLLLVIQMLLPPIIL